MKDKFTYPEMIQHMHHKGITFEHTSSKEVRKILSNTNYYFKLTGYRRNFSKIDGKYVDLDFAYLLDIASIDCQLRIFLLEMSLNVEHAL
jgi:hypothetical protein